MTEKEKLALIYRVVSGYTIIDDYIIDTPTDSLLNESLVVREQVMFKYRFEDLLSEDMTERVLLSKKLWTPENSSNLKELDKALDDCRFELYKSYGLPPTQIKKIRDRLNLIKKKKNEQLGLKHCLDRFTLEGLGDYAAEMYVFSKSILNKEYKPVKLHALMVDTLVKKYKKKWPTTENLRLVARTEPWRSFWSTNPNCFRTMGDEQKVLVLFSKMYDDVYQHTDRPVDDIINDDDMLDGWFISIKRKNEQIRKENVKNSILEKHPNADHIFMLASTPEHVKEINEMNTVEAKVIKGQRDEALKRKTLVRDKDIMALNIGKQNG